MIPRDESFYPLFDQLAQIAADTAVALSQAMRSLPVSGEASDAVAMAEKQADGVLLEVPAQLEHAIVTPSDREDIQSLSNALDDVVDELRRRLVGAVVVPRPLITPPRPFLTVHDRSVTAPFKEQPSNL